MRIQWRSRPPQNGFAAANMIYHLSLQTAGMAAGAFLILISLPGLFKPDLANAAKRFPRSRVAGVVLLTVSLLWTFWLLATIEMGEFAAFRRPLLIALPIGYVLVLRFVDEFLAVRALGILCLLAAEPLLDARNRVGLWRGHPRFRVYSILKCSGRRVGAGLKVCR